MNAPDPRARLLALSAERRVSLAQLSGLIGRNAAYLQQFVRKGSPRKLEEGDRATLARFLGVSEAELGGSEENSYISQTRLRDGYVAVPRLPLEASAGPGALTGAEQPFDAFRFSAAWLRARDLDPAMLSMIEVSGDSMSGTLEDGDEIMVDHTPGPPRDGVHVVAVDGAILVKRLDTGRPGTVALISDNPVYARVDLPAEDVRVIGRVVWRGARV